MKQANSKLYHYVLMFFSIIFVGALHAQQSIEATIQGGVTRPLTILIPDFGSYNTPTGFEAKLATLIGDDLASTGVLAPQRVTAEETGFNDDVDYSALSGSEAYLRGAIGQSPDGQIQVRFRIFDAIAQSEIGEGLELTGPVGDWRRIGHKIADEVYARLTAEGKYFDSKFVFVSETGPKGDRRKAIAVSDSDGANLRYLTNGNTIVFAPRWANNARDVIFTSLSQDSAEIVLLNTENGSLRVLDNLAGLAFAPRVSPDGRQVVASLIDDQANADLYVIDLATGAQTRLTSTPSIETAPSFSPDGQTLVFESDLSGTQQLYVMSAQGGAATQLSQGAGRYATPVWSPKGDLIAFTKIIDGEFQIGVMNADGTGERIVTSGAKDEQPSWAPNGRVLTFFRETPGAEGGPKLYTISLTGNFLRAIPTPDFASDPNWSPLLD